ncbi:cupin [Virgibacillus dakarensis]|uniref:cupin domain-containing protein n=1 Tax=Virgibacillus dakarensis TaxID=1917889 RepID=UPI000B43C6A1|nr:cupin [Virgibacillus dakarensis]MTW86584.1 cupin [Virgibacillus dakarensis]
MEIFRIYKETGTRITSFNSNFIMNRILKTDLPMQIGYVHLEKNGVIGYHQATVPQLLIVLDGEGKVREESEEFLNIQKGNAVFWSKDEWHETITEQGLTAIIIEGEGLKPLFSAVNIDT